MQTTPPFNTPDSESPLTGDALLELLQSLKEQNRLQQRTLDEQAEIIGKKSDVIGAQKKRIAILEEYLRLAKHKQYAPSREKNALQGELFNEAELLADGDSDVSGEVTPEPDTGEEKAKPKKRKKCQACRPIYLVKRCITFSVRKKRKVQSTPFLSLLKKSLR